MFSLKSHKASSIIKAIDTGFEIWSLDSQNSGNDDVCFGSREEIEHDIVSWIDDPEYPDFESTGWTLNQIVGEELVLFRAKLAAMM